MSNLPEATIVCPHCERTNPVSQLWCVQCGCNVHVVPPPKTEEERQERELREVKDARSAVTSVAFLMCLATGPGLAFAHWMSGGTAWIADVPIPFETMWQWAAAGGLFAGLVIGEGWHRFCWSLIFGVANTASFLAFYGYSTGLDRHRLLRIEFFLVAGLGWVIGMVIPFAILSQLVPSFGKSIETKPATPAPSTEGASPGQSSGTVNSRVEETGGEKPGG